MVNIATIKMVMTGGWFIVDTVDTLRRSQTSRLKYPESSNSPNEIYKMEVSSWKNHPQLVDCPENSLFDNCYCHGQIVDMIMIYSLVN